ncbi:hypothetical protein WH95_01885 [Kiloniella litopenaei]|uniref:DUF5801 domain-containing protein n=1 Tax=Kiloniella litopenaei TaxID=1549748 RepID=A0A0M2R891_9PROT|nr:DUF5801 repeats-in-toxin domain-containing protein [Kiloniella litopenaei]KKJ78127.1 hypothetical protein WH95_01885 [Kiloniella litopenaei]
MTESFTTTGDKNVSGEEGQDLLVGQAASAVEITAPTGGETKTISLERGQTATLNFDATAATPVLEGNDFVLTFDSNGDGSADSRIVFQNLVEDAQGEDAPVLVIGGIELPAGLLIGQAQALVEGETLETAAGAGAGPQGGGGSTYSDDFGETIDGLNAQGTIGGTLTELAAAALAADNPDPAEGTFSFTFATTVVDGADVNGAFVGGFEDWQANQHLDDETESPMQIAFTFVPADNEVVDSIDITSLPVGVTLYVGGFAPENIVFSSVPGEEVGTLPINILGTDLDEVYLKGDEHSDADIPVTITANISDPDSGETASITASGTAIIDAAADKPDLGLNADEKGSPVETGVIYNDDFSNLDNWTVFQSSGTSSVNGGTDTELSPSDDGGEGGENGPGLSTSSTSNDGPAVADFLGVSIEDLNTAADNGDEEVENFEDGNGSAVKSVLTVQAGQTLTFDFNFIDREGSGGEGGEGTEYNDTAFIVINGEIHVLGQSVSGSEDGVFTYTFAEGGDVEIGIAVFNEDDTAVNPSLILENLSIEGNLISQDEETPELTTIPVSLTFDDFADGSETHEVKLEGVPADWVLDLEETFGEHAGLVTVTSEESGGFVTYTFDITDYVDRLNGIDPVTDTPDGIVGDGSVTIDFTFDPLDWTSQRLNDGSENEDGPAEITVTATATETDLSGADLTDLNDVSTTVDAVVVDIQEDVPEVQDATLVHDESPFPQGDANDVWWIESSAGIAIASSGFHFDEVDSVPGLLGFAENEISVNFFSDGPNTGDAATDSTVDDNNVGQESFEFQSYDGSTPSVLQTTAGEAIFLHTDPANPNIVWGLTEDGDAVFAVHLEQPSAGESSSLTASFVQFQSVKNPNPDSHDEVTAALNLQIRAIDDEGDASEYANLAITIQDDGPSIGYIRNNNDDLKESDLTRGDHKDSVSGRIFADFGVDGGKFTGLELKSVTDPDGTAGDAVAPGFDGNLTSNGVPVVFGSAVVINGKLTLIGKAGDDEIIKVTLDEDSGSFKATLLGPIDHPDQNGDQQVGSRDQLKLTFTATVTDGDGDTASKDFSVRVKDDGPDADSEYRTHKSSWASEHDILHGGAAVDGTLDVDFGADGGAITDVEFIRWSDTEDNNPNGTTLTSGGEDVTFGPAEMVGGQLVMVGTVPDGNGGTTPVVTVTINPTSGAYTVDVTKGIDHPDLSLEDDANDKDPLSLQFRYTITDNDGDTDTANLVVVIEDDEADAHDTYASEDISEANLLDNDNTNDSVSGTLDIDHNADGIAVVDLWFEGWEDSEDGNPDGAVLKSGGKDVDFGTVGTDSAGNLVLVGTIDGGATDIVTLKVDPETGEYTVTLHGPVDHPDQSTDGSNTTDPLTLDFGFKVRDGDGDEDEETLSIYIEDSEPVVDSNLNALVQLDDDALAGGHAGGTGDVDPDTANLTGTLNFAAGADGVESVLLTGVSLPSGAGFSSVLSNDGTVLTVSQVINGVSTDVFRVNLTDKTSGAYTVTQLAAVAHTAGLDENNTDFTVTYEVVDKDGDSASGSISINVDDDSPLAVDDNGEVTEAGTLDVAAVDGVLSNDEQGADGAVVSGIVAGTGTPVALGTPIETDYGFLTMNADGSYTYEAKSDMISDDVVDTFTYEIKDADGDVSTATLNITVKDAVPTVNNANNARIKLDDDALAGGHAGGVGDADPDSENLTGTLDFDAGADGIQSIVLAGMAGGGGATPSLGIYFSPTEITLAQDIEGDGSYVNIFKITLSDTTSGAYTITQLAPLHHVSGIDENNAQFRINYQVTDNDGDIANGHIWLDLNDDSPLAVVDSGDVDEGETLTVLAAGGVLVNDHLGADGAVVTGVVAGDGTPVALGAPIETAYGTLTLSEDGSYTYEAKANVTDVDLVDSFTYEITDADGDTSTATLDINVTAVTAPPPPGTDESFDFVPGTLIDGGDGFDTLVIPGAGAGNQSIWIDPVGAQNGVNVDLQPNDGAGNGLIRNIEVIDLTNGSTGYEDFGVFAPELWQTSTGMLSVEDVIDITDDNNILYIMGDGAKDGVHLEAGNSVPGGNGDTEIAWTATGNSITGSGGTIDGVTFNEYVGTGAGGEDVKLYVEDDLTVTIFGTV